jgi:hypothetical protein
MQNNVLIQRIQSSPQLVGTATAQSQSPSARKPSSVSPSVRSSRFRIRPGLSVFQFLQDELYPSDHINRILMDTSEGSLTDQALKAAQKQSTIIFRMFNIPFSFESFASFGVACCLLLYCDFVFLLPIRIMICFVKCLVMLMRNLVNLSLCRKHLMSWTLSMSNFDLDYVLLVIPAAFSIWTLLRIDVSWLYHTLRGRSILSLFLFFHVSYVTEKILAAFGADFFPFKPFGKIVSFRYLVEYIGLSLYMLGHSLSVFVSVLSLHAAMNSVDASFVAILCSSNYLELKGSILKRFSSENLFQIGSSDVVERFQLIIFGGLIVIRTSAEPNCNLQRTVDYVLKIIVMEIMVDWIKHAFVTKFNAIKPDTYRSFTSIICKDLANTYKSSGEVFAALTKRLGLVSIPYICTVSPLCLSNRN